MIFISLFHSPFFFFCLFFLIRQLPPSKLKLGIRIRPLCHDQSHWLRPFVSLLQPHVIIDEEKSQNELDLISGKESTRAGVLPRAKVEIRVVERRELPAIARLGRLLPHVVKSQGI